MQKGKVKDKKAEKDIEMQHNLQLGYTINLNLIIIAIWPTANLNLARCNYV